MTAGAGVLADMSTKLRTLLAIAALAFGYGGIGPAIAGPEPVSNAGTSFNSFLGQTPVLLSDGTRTQIERVSPGDLVLSTDPATGELSKREVLEVFAGRGERHMYALTIDGAPESQRLFATAGHAFHLVDRGYTPIERIGQDGLKVLVRQVDDLGVRPNVTVYNLRIEGTRTFTVVSNATRIVTYGAR
jgi:hypothetical protein